MGYDVTIGIPVYNSADYIRRSLESALAQTYTFIEFLIVNDACSDNSMDIIISIKQTHPRGNNIHIITNQTNLGVSASRNQIIDNALGDYLYFMDSDDVIADNTIELLMQNARLYNAEIVFGSYERIENSGRKTLYQYPSIQLLKEDGLASFAYRKYGGIQASVCNYLVKTSVLRDNNLRFIDTNYWEDFVFTFDLVTFISRAVLLPDITYTYICRENSLSHYQQRNMIPKGEILQNVRAVDHLKLTSSVLSDKVYYPNRCYYIVMTDFYIACNILKHRNSISPYISNYEVKELMKHPASFSKIVSFQKVRLENLFLYFLGQLPAFLSVLLISCLAKAKKLV